MSNNGSAAELTCAPDDDSHVKGRLLAVEVRWRWRRWRSGNGLEGGGLQSPPSLGSTAATYARRQPPASREEATHCTSSSYSPSLHLPPPPPPTTHRPTDRGSGKRTVMLKSGGLIFSPPPTTTAHVELCQDGCRT